MAAVLSVSADPQFTMQQGKLDQHYSGIVELLEKCGESFRKHQQTVQLATSSSQLAGVDFAAHNSLFYLMQELLAVGMGIASVQPKEQGVIN